MTPITSIADTENITPNSVYGRERVIYAKSFWQYLVGLALREDFDGVMVFEYKKPVNLIIHTTGMKFSLDIDCYNDKNEIVKEVKNMAPWRFMYVKGVKWFAERKHIIEKEDNNECR